MGSVRWNRACPQILSWWFLPNSDLDFSLRIDKTKPLLQISVWKDLPISKYFGWCANLHEIWKLWVTVKRPPRLGFSRPEIQASLFFLLYNFHMVLTVLKAILRCLNDAKVLLMKLNACKNLDHGVKTLCWWKIPVEWGNECGVCKYHFLFAKIPPLFSASLFLLTPFQIGDVKLGRLMCY